MRYLFLLALSLSLFACKESTSEFDSLSASDQDYIRNLSSAKCRTQIANNVNTFKDNTENSWGSTSYQRGDGYRQEFKYAEGSAAASLKSSVEFQVWNIINDDIYFYVIEERDPPGSKYFLKLNRVTNSEIIDQLAEDHCVKAYKSSSLGSSNMTIGFDYYLPNVANFDHYVDTYTLEYTKPAYFGPYNVKRTITTTDRNGTGGTVIGSVKTYTSTWAAKAVTFAAGITFDNTTYYTQKFCIPALTSTTTPPAYQLTTTSSPSVEFKYGFNYTCTTTYPDTAGGWDLSY